MKLDKLLLALLVISLVLFAVPASVRADGNDSNNSTDTEDDEEDDDSSVDDGLNESVENNSSIDDDENEADVEDQNENETDDEDEFDNENETNDHNQTEIEDDNENESSEDLSDETEINDEDVSVLKYNHGAEVRLLQLQKSVVKHIKIGNLIVGEIDNQNFSVDTAKLEGYVEDMEDLNEEITDALAEDPINVSVEQFVAWKHEAIKITYQFKAELYTILTPEQLKIIKDAIKDKTGKKNSDELKVEAKFKGKVKEYNEEVALKMLEKFGGNDEQRRARIMAGNLSAKDLKVELREEYKNLGEARKNQLKLKIGEEKDNETRQKFELEAKVRGLNRSEVAKIASDKSLTLEEKQAKIRVLIEEQKALNKTWNNEDGSAGNGKGNGRK